MNGERDGYDQSVDAGTMPDFRANLIRRYFKRYPVKLPHNEEPSPQWLAAVDDHVVDKDKIHESPEEKAVWTKELEFRREVSLRLHTLCTRLIPCFLPANISLAAQQSQSWYEYNQEGHATNTPSCH